MENELLKTCPACEAFLEVNDLTRGDWTEYRCNNHGQFILSKTLSITLTRNPQLIEKMADYLKKPFDRDKIICTYHLGV